MQWLFIMLALVLVLVQSTWVVFVALEVKAISLTAHTSLLSTA